MGCRNSLRTRVLAENTQTFIAGCNCHLAHLAAGKSGKAYTSSINFDCEDHQVDLYYFSKRRTCRKGILNNILTCLVVNGKTLRDSFQLSSYP